MTGQNENMQGNGEIMLFDRKHPYDTPGQVCDDVPKTRSGPCSNEPFAKYAQCSVPYMPSRIAIAMTVAAAGAPIVIKPFETTIYQTGQGGPITDQGFPAGIQGGKLSEADTLVVSANQGNGGIAPDNNLTYRINAFEMGFQEIFRAGATVPPATTGAKTFGVPFLKFYNELIAKVLLTEMVLHAKFGGTVFEQSLGTPSLWRHSNFRDNNPESGKPTWIRCQWLTGGPNDSDKLKLNAILPFEIAIDNDLGAPTVAGTYYAQFTTWAFGALECRDADGICPAPGSKKVEKVEADMAVMQNTMSQMVATLNQLTAKINAK